MTLDNDRERSFIIELYNATQGDLTAKTTMQEVGAAMGLDKEQAGKTAEDLIGKGFIEIKTLSGGIGITTDGIEIARQEGAAPTGAADLKLSAGPFLDDDDRGLIEALLKDIKKNVAVLKSDYAQLEEVVVDIKTIEVHLLSPKPKMAVIRELLRALEKGLNKAETKEIAGRIACTIG